MEGQNNDQNNMMGAAPSNMNSGAPAPMLEEHGSNGPLIGSIIIVLLIILGGVYFYAQRLNPSNQNQTQEQQSGQNNPAAEPLGQSPSDDLSSIKNDLNSANAGDAGAAESQAISNQLSQ